MNYEVSFELAGLKGLKLTIKGNKDEFPRDLGQQLSSLLVPSIAIPPATDHVSRLPYASGNGNGVVTAEPTVNESKRAPKKRNSGSSAATASQPLSLTFDQAKWGVPLQGWNPTKKSVWLLRVLSQSVDNRNEFTASELAATFNKYFKDARTVLAGNITRDLTKAAAGSVTTNNQKLVGTNSSSEPKTWFLTQDGTRYADQLVEEAKRNVAPSQA